MARRRHIALSGIVWVAACSSACSGLVGGGGDDDDPDASLAPSGTDAATAAPDAGAVDPGLEPMDELPPVLRFDLASPNCTAELLESGAGCRPEDTKCLCRPEFDALNAAKGGPGNPAGRFILISQPRYGLRTDGTYVFDAFTAIKEQGNFVGHYVNELNPPPVECAAAGSWSGVGCAAGQTGCGWRCISGGARADEIIADEIAAYGAYASPRAIALNEATSNIYEDSDTGKDYRLWLLELTRRLAEKGRWPLLYVQERHIPSSRAYGYLSEMAAHTWFMVEAYLSGREVLAAPGRCAAPYDRPTNWCYQQYRTIRNAVRDSASPPIPYSRLLMVEHFANNTLHYVEDGVERINGWGRALDSGSPSVADWNMVIARRALVMKSLLYLPGVGSYAWGGNGAHVPASDRVKFATTYSNLDLP